MSNVLASALAHLYVHVPFCDGKCHYCGFYSGEASAETRRSYASLPGRELQLLAAAEGLPLVEPLLGHADGGGAPSLPSETRVRELGRPLGAPRTIYFGGGTPAMLGEAGLRELVDGLRKSASFEAVEEWTVELNPGDVTPAWCAALRELGVNRVPGSRLSA